MSKVALITGITGQDGSYLAEFLLEKGYEGKPKISVYLQIIDILILIPCCIIGVEYGLETFVIIRCFARLDIVIPSLLIVSKLFKISIKSIMNILSKPVLFTIAMYFVGAFTKNVFDSYS